MAIFRKQERYFSLIKADDNLDNGDIILKQKFEFDYLDLYEDIMKRAFSKN